MQTLPLHHGSLAIYSTASYPSFPSGDPNQLDGQLGNNSNKGFAARTEGRPPSPMSLARQYSPPHSPLQPNLPDQGLRISRNRIASQMGSRYEQVSFPAGRILSGISSYRVPIWGLPTSSGLSIGTPGKNSRYSSLGLGWAKDVRSQFYAVSHRNLSVLLVNHGNWKRSRTRIAFMTLRERSHEGIEAIIKGIRRLWWGYWLMQDVNRTNRESHDN